MRSRTLYSLRIIEHVQEAILRFFPSLYEPNSHQRIAVSTGTGDAQHLVWFTEFPKVLIAPTKSDGMGSAPIHYAELSACQPPRTSP